MEAEAANHLVVATPTQVHDFNEDVSTKDDVLLFEGEIYAVTAHSLDDVALRILMNLVIVVCVVELSLKTESILDLRQVLYHEILELDALWARHCLRKKLVIVENVPQL